ESIAGTSVISSLGSTVELRRDASTSVRQILEQANALAEIIEFAVIQPSLHEIFVRTVTGSSDRAAA
ncbi:MAG: DUF4162 domain-containing protein, partial [Candidatus Kapaibacterium sp.]